MSKHNPKQDSFPWILFMKTKFIMSFNKTKVHNLMLPLNQIAWKMGMKTSDISAFTVKGKVINIGIEV